MKNNYPIKYAIMSMIIDENLYNEKEYNEIGYIASKCYVVNEIKKYLENGNINVSYEVVFPFKINQYGELVRFEPSFDIYGECINSVSVTKLFDNYEEANKYAKEKNDKIINEMVRNLPYNSNLQQNIEKIAQQKKSLTNYKNLKLGIQEITKELNINNVPKEQRIILANNGVFKILNDSLYDFIKIYFNNNFVVYNISIEDFNELKIKIQKKFEINENNINKKILLKNNIDKKIINIISDVNSEPDEYFYIKDNKMYSDINKEILKDNNDELIQNNLIVYTIEDYKDIILSYLPKFMFNEPEETNKILKKFLIK